MGEGTSTPIIDKESVSTNVFHSDSEEWEVCRDLKALEDLESWIGIMSGVVEKQQKASSFMQKSVFEEEEESVHFLLSEEIISIDDAEESSSLSSTLKAS